MSEKAQEKSTEIEIDMKNFPDEFFPDFQLTILEIDVLREFTMASFLYSDIHSIGNRTSNCCTSDRCLVLILRDRRASSKKLVTLFYVAML